ncbi:SCRB3 family protein [Megaselia abdita]
MKLKMGLTNHYLRIGQRVRELLLGISLNSQRRSDSNEFNSRTTQMSMLISHRTKFNNRRLSVIIIGVITLIIGILLSSIPWLDYFILKNLRLWNDTLSYYYWQRPGVIRLTKLYIYNVTNPDGFLRGDKPKLREIGPFVYKEDMEKVNIKFHENFTVSYQHKKILRFVPELSIDKNTEIVTPNIPLLTLTSQSNSLGILLSKALSLAVNMAKYKPFISVTADQLAFGYDDALVSLAHTFYPKHKRPMDRMGLLIGRNGTLTEVSSIHTGHNSMKNFGYINKLNGLNYISAWKGTSCASVNGSEGSFFPPRDITKLNSVNVYDKDLCRVIPLVYQETVEKDGIEVDLFELDKKAYGNSKDNKENECFDDYSFAPEVGIQNISPCHYGAPVYLSNPHFYQTDDIYLNSVEGLTPNKTIHKTYFKIQPVRLNNLGFKPN